MWAKTERRVYRLKALARRICDERRGGGGGGGGSEGGRRADSITFLYLNDSFSQKSCV